MFKCQSYTVPKKKEKYKDNSMKIKVLIKLCLAVPKDL